ncbi:LysE family translocator [Neptuniibacter halophilus]|uniref:LysE family translocator n=1 Tax=Neptuniibacter halophilus TaxID=651666 RepID=UPI0025733EDC|nr:LysE family transporter [Neptuniibacter halophilus]
MVEILLYAFGIMYTPGPVNLLSMNAGLNGQARQYLGFCLGVGSAMLVLFLLFGYAGVWLISPQWQQPIAILGSAYVLYLAGKILHASWRQSALTARQDESRQVSHRFHHGLLLQLLNPKAPVAILPIVTIQFPEANISGSGIAFWSLILSILAFGAPGTYLLLGQLLGKKLQALYLFRVINLAMGCLLTYTGLMMLAGALND